MNAAENREEVLREAHERLKDHPVLSRLIEEVRNELVTDVGRYDRIHNRHNRGI